MDWDSHRSAVLFVLGNLLNVDAVSQSVDLGDLSLGSSESLVSSEDFDFIISSDWQRLNSVLLSEVRAQNGAQKSVFEVRRG